MIANGWISEYGLTTKGNSFGMMKIFQTVIVVLVLKLHKYVKASEPVYLKRINFTTCKLCLSKPDLKKWR